MNVRKAALIFAVAACAAIFLPLTHSLADGIQAFQTSAQTDHTAFASDANDEQREYSEPLVALQDGDTILLDNAGQEIGSLRVTSADGTLLFITGEYQDGIPAKVLYGETESITGQWLQRKVDQNGVSAQLLYVSVAYGDAFSTVKAGWINTANVLNLPGIMTRIISAPLLEQIETLNQKLELAEQTPVPINTPAPTPPAEDEKPKVLDMRRDSPLDLAIDSFSLVFLILIFAAMHPNKRKKAEIERAEITRTKSAVMDCLMETKVPTLLEEIKTNGKTVEQLARNQLDISAAQLRPEDTRPELRVMKDWEELAAIAQSAMSETSFENWENAFRSKNWIPLGIQPTTMNISGVFEIAVFDRTQSFALFAPHDPAEKGRYYLIPSINDRDLRSNQLSDFFDLCEGELTPFEPYRIVKPAVLQTQNDRFFKYLFKGEIRIPFRTQE